jgi:hypothetical protein
LAASFELSACVNEERVVTGGLNYNAIGLSYVEYGDA